MHFHDVVGHGDEDAVAKVEEHVPQPQGQREGHPVQEAAEPPLKSINGSRDRR